VHSILLLSDHGEKPDTRVRLAGDYETRLGQCAGRFEFPDFDENTVATLFYTTGTTGEPKGVFFTHRQLVLHTLSAGFALGIFQQPLGFSQDDVYMPLTPMFHVHAWGVPYIATLVGVRQVYPGRYEPRLLLHLVREHRVTLSHCVPTILQMLLHHPEAKDVDFSGWKIIIGGAALPPALARQAMERGIKIMQGYGMSETCPIIAISQFKPEVVRGDAAAQLDIIGRTGFPLPLVSARAVDPEGRPLPAGRDHQGELVLKAPWLTAGYYKEEERSRELWRTGWLHTGDLAFMDADGYVRITDRLKDVIKVGGEWISSLELESILIQHEAVKEVAVVGVPDAKWDERPYAAVVLRDTHRDQVTPRELMAFLHRFIDTGIVHKRAILTHIHLVEALPRTSVGKFDKKALRVQATGSARPASR
jgi:fatty-acyl-CoA synthase